jgi:hypothetical protein
MVVRSKLCPVKVCVQFLKVRYATEQTHFFKTLKKEGKSTPL